MLRKIAVVMVSFCVFPLGCAAGPAGSIGGGGPAAVLTTVEKQFGPPVMWVARPEAPPVIDGRLDDAAWGSASPVALGYLVDGWDTPTQKTVARVLADEKAVYFAVKCWEAEPQRVIAAGDQRDGALWQGDTVEVFLDPGHKEQRKKYFHVIVNPAGLLYDSKDGQKSWNGSISAAVGKFPGGWTVELAVRMKDLGVAGAIPKVWGLNVNRQRPELGEIDPVGRLTAPSVVKLKDPSKYRLGEDTAWSPTYCESSHIAERFGHAVLQVGTVPVAPPEKLFEILYKSDFDDGSTAGWWNAEIVDDNFRGPGKCLAPKGGTGAVQLTRPLKDMDDVTIIYALKMPQDGRFSYYGRAPDNEQCEADRHEVFMTEAAAAARKWVGMDGYCTHASKMAWKPFGKRWKGPGPWVMMTGHFSEPSIGNVMWPGKDWVVVRTRLGMLRRQRSQALVPMSQNYPRGLTFAAGKRWMLDDIVIFRGADVEPPERPSGVEVRRQGGDLVVSWNRAKDNTLTAYYRVYVYGRPMVQTHRLSVRIKGGRAGERPVSVVACDFYGNCSKPGTP